MPVTAHPASQRAADPVALRALRAGFRALRAVHRPTAAKLATRLFARPRRHARPEWESGILAGAERRSVHHKDKRIACYLWAPTAGSGEGEAPTALLVHGWEGRGTQLGRFVDPLRAAGFTVVAFDHVGHGDSDGRACSLPTMRDTLRAIAAEFFGEGAGPELVVAHHGVLRGQPAARGRVEDDQAVYVSPPDDLLVYFGHYLDLVTGDDELLPDMIELWSAASASVSRTSNSVGSSRPSTRTCSSSTRGTIPTSRSRPAASSPRTGRGRGGGAGRARASADPQGPSVVAAALAFAGDGPVGPSLRRFARMR